MEFHGSLANNWPSVWNGVGREREKEGVWFGSVDNMHHSISVQIANRNPHEIQYHSEWLGDVIYKRYSYQTANGRWCAQSESLLAKQSPVEENILRTVLLRNSFSWKILKHLRHIAFDFIYILIKYFLRLFCHWFRWSILTKMGWSSLYYTSADVQPNSFHSASTFCNIKFAAGKTLAQKAFPMGDYFCLQSKYRLHGRSTNYKLSINQHIFSATLPARKIWTQN